MQVVSYQGVQLTIPNRYAIPDLLNRFKNNSYESEEIQLIKFFNKEDTVLELGACLGFLTNKIAPNVKHIVSVEANPELIPALENTKILNNNTNITVVNCIVDTEHTTKEFQTYDLVVAGSADRQDLLDSKQPNKWGKGVCMYTVKCKTLQDLEKENNCRFNTLLVDIEGGEFIFFEQIKNILKEQIQKVIVELHGRFMSDPNFNIKCTNLLQESGFKILKKIGNTIYCEKQSS